MMLKNIKSFYNKLNKVQKIIILLFCLFSLFNLATITWGMPNFTSWSVDDPTALFTLSYMSNFGEGTYKYTPLNFVINAIVYIPILAIYYLTGTLSPEPAYPYGFENVDLQVGILIMASRLLNFLLYLATIYFIFKTSETIKKGAGFYAGLTYALSPLIVQMSTLGNTDNLMMFSVSIALYYVVKLFLSKESKTAKTWLFVGASLALVASSKELGLTLFVLPLIAIALSSTNFSKGGIQKTLVEIFKSIAVFILIYVILNNLILNFSGWIGHLQTWLPGGRGVADTWGHYQGIELFFRTCKAIFLSSPLLFFTGIIGFVVSLFHKKEKMLGLLLFSGLLSYYTFAINYTNFVFLRYTMPILLVLSIFTGVLFSQKKFIIKKYVVVPVLILFFVFAIIPVYGKFTDSRYSAEENIVSLADNKSVFFHAPTPYHVYSPRINQIVANEAFTPSYVDVNDSIRKGLDSDLYVIQYGLYEQNHEVFNNHTIIYDSGKIQPFYYTWESGLSPCRISCRNLVLQKK